MADEPAAKARTEVRGGLMALIQEVFPHIGGLLPAEYQKAFEDIDPDGWYDAAAYRAAVDYLSRHVSGDVVELLGARVTLAFTHRLRARGITTVERLAAELPATYAELVRGPEAGEWFVDEFQPGRAVVRERSLSESEEFATGVIKASLEYLGACNIRVTVFERRAEGAPFNRYLVEWIDPGTAGG
jgi:hypothetical protein